MNKIRLLRVSSRRNSTCGSAPLYMLDWARWFTDGGPDSLYLHVHHYRDDSIHRVFCRHNDHPRLAMRDGALYWLIDGPRSGVGK